MKTYFYDKKQKKYKPVENNQLKKFIHTACMWIIGGVILCGIIVGILYHTAASPAILALRAENQVLHKKLKHTQVAINKFQAQLQNLAHDDNKLYRTVLGMKRIPKGERKGGVGGAEVYKKYDVYGAKTASILTNVSRSIDQMRHAINIQQASFRAIRKAYKKHKKKFSHIPAIKPAKGFISSGFGMRYHPILHVYRMHTGVDIAALVGTKIYATADGVVEYAGPKGAYGNIVIIDNGYGYETYFAHMSAIAKGIEPGAKVHRGEVIGYVGQTGLTTGPHVHYEVRINGKPVNPVAYFYANTSPQEYLKYKKQAKASTKSMD